MNFLNLKEKTYQEIEETYHKDKIENLYGIEYRKFLGQLKSYFKEKLEFTPYKDSFRVLLTTDKVIFSLSDSVNGKEVYKKEILLKIPTSSIKDLKEQFVEERLFENEELLSNLKKEMETYFDKIILELIWQKDIVTKKVKEFMEDKLEKERKAYYYNKYIPTLKLNFRFIDKYFFNEKTGTITVQSYDAEEYTKNHGIYMHSFYSSNIYNDYMLKFNYNLDELMKELEDRYNTFESNIFEHFKSKIILFYKENYDKWFTDWDFVTVKDFKMLEADALLESNAKYKEEDNKSTKTSTLYVPPAPKKLDYLYVKNSLFMNVNDCLRFNKQTMKMRMNLKTLNIQKSCLELQLKFNVHCSDELVNVKEGIIYNVV